MENEDQIIFDDEEKERSPLFQKILLGLVIFFSLLLIGTGFLIYSLFFSGSTDASISISAPDSISRGVPFTISVSAANPSETPILDASVSLSLPQGIVQTEGGDAYAFSEKVGDIQGGGVIKKTYSLLALDPEGTHEKISASLSYSTGESSRFDTKTEKEIVLGADTLRVNASFPEQIMRGSQFTFELQYANPTSVNIQNVFLRATYPNTYHFDSASKDPSGLNNEWSIGTLKAGASGVIEVTGTYDGFDTESLEVPVMLFTKIGKKEYALAEAKSSQTLQPSPIALQILVNGESSYIARAGDTLAYSVRYENKSGITLQKVVLSLAISGTMANLQTIDTDGKVDKKNGIITWDSSNVDSFKGLASGESGEVHVKISLRDTTPMRTASNKNYSVVARAKIESPSVPYYLSAVRTSSAANMETKVGGSIGVGAELQYRDPDSGIANSGPFPPKVGQATEYTIHWYIENFSTDMRNVSIRAHLESGVEMGNVVRSNAETKPQFDATTGDVVWNIPFVAAGRGVVDDALEATFQVRATPSKDQIKQFMPIMKETILTATDNFTGVETSARDTGLSTALPDDKTVGAEGGKVTQ